MSDLDFGFRVRSRRRLLGISQDDLGKAVGISQVAIKKIEAGGNTRHGRKIAATLETTLQWLETGADSTVDNNGNSMARQIPDQSRTVSVSEPRADAHPSLLTSVTPDRIQALTPDQRKKLDEMVDAVLKGFEAERKSST